MAIPTFHGLASFLTPAFQTPSTISTSLVPATIIICLDRYHGFWLVFLLPSLSSLEVALDTVILLRYTSDHRCSAPNPPVAFHCIRVRVIIFTKPYKMHISRLSDSSPPTLPLAYPAPATVASLLIHLWAFPSPTTVFPAWPRGSCLYSFKSLPKYQRFCFCFF